MRITAVLIAGVLLHVGAGNAFAQVSYGGGRAPSQAVGLSVANVQFSFDGSTNPAVNFNFDQPVYGIVFSRPGMIVGAGRGRQPQSDGNSLTLTDFHLTAWGVFRPVETTGIRPTIPIGIQSSYRRVSRAENTGTFDAFEFTVLALGAGVGIEHEANAASVTARIMPMFGIASRSIGTDTGTSAILDGDIEATFGPWGRRLGLMVGYGFRWQRWNLNTSRFLPEATDDTFDYSGSMHTFRLGVLF